MRVVVVGATGNVGTSLLAALAEEERVDSILGLARRLPRLVVPKVEWDARTSRSRRSSRFSAAPTRSSTLAWLIQPARDLELVRRVNVDGSARVFRAVAEAGVPALVYASSVGAYSPGPKDRPVDEYWPVDGIATSFYSRHKAEVERLLDRFEAKHPEVRVVRLRPGLIFKREAASGIRRLFAGPFLPSPLLRPAFQRFVPDLPGLRFQAVYSLDAGDAYRLAIVRDVRGAFNIAVEPVLDAARLAEVLDARPARTARAPRRPPRARRPGHAAARAADRRPAADPRTPDRRRRPLARAVPGTCLAPLCRAPSPTATIVRVGGDCHVTVTRVGRSAEIRASNGARISRFRS